MLPLGAALAVALALPVAGQAGAATAAATCVSSPDGGARACYDPGRQALSIADLLADGHRASAPFRLTAGRRVVTGTCETTAGAGSARQCSFRLPGDTASTLCFRAQTRDGATVVSTSPQRCVRATAPRG